MSRLDENIGSMAYDGLIVANTPEADVFHVSIRANEGDLARGTVLALSTGSAGDGKMVILGTTAITNETLTANCILAEAVTVGATAATALAYRTGHFNRDALIVKAATTLTAAHEEDLRKDGILLSDAAAY
ncbi:MAG: head decoration protein [Candidatus Dehalobacter alkaniphilus]